MALQAAHRLTVLSRRLTITGAWIGSLLTACCAGLAAHGPGPVSSAAPSVAISSSPTVRRAASSGPAESTPVEAEAVTSSEASAPQPTADPKPVPERTYPFHAPLPDQSFLKKAPATRVATLSPTQCRAELRKRKLAIQTSRKGAAGVATPVRLQGSLAGVRFVGPNAKSIYGMLDCRLALALEEFARVLAPHGIVEVHIDNMYRPRARIQGRRVASQHAYGLAVDIGAMKLADGRLLVVDQHWTADVGQPACGPDVNLKDLSEEEAVLRNAVCDVARAGVFHHMLTPNYNAAHRNHFHFDIKRDAQTIAIR